MVQCTHCVFKLAPLSNKIILLIKKRSPRKATLGMTSKGDDTESFEVNPKHLPP